MHRRSDVSCCVSHTSSEKCWQGIYYVFYSLRQWTPGLHSREPVVNFPYLADLITRCERIMQLEVFSSFIVTLPK
jgi:hypothetical protein